MKKISLKRTNFVGVQLSRAQLKKILGGNGETTDGESTTTSEAMPCDNVVCHAEDWCCDTTGLCVSRNQTTC